MNCVSSFYSSSEAEPSVLSKYVLALIQTGLSEKQLRLKCLNQLEIFLGNETALFVDRLLAALRNKSYTDLDSIQPSTVKSETTNNTTDGDHSTPLPLSDGSTSASLSENTMMNSVSKENTLNGSSQSTSGTNFNTLPESKSEISNQNDQRRLSELETFGSSQSAINVSSESKQHASNRSTARSRSRSTDSSSDHENRGRLRQNRSSSSSSGSSSTDSTQESYGRHKYRSSAHHRHNNDGDFSSRSSKRRGGDSINAVSYRERNDVRGYRNNRNDYNDRPTYPDRRGYSSRSNPRNGRSKYGSDNQQYSTYRNNENGYRRNDFNRRTEQPPGDDPDRSYWNNGRNEQKSSNVLCEGVNNDSVNAQYILSKPTDESSIKPNFGESGTSEQLYTPDVVASAPTLSSIHDCPVSREKGFCNDGQYCVYNANNLLQNPNDFYMEPYNPDQADNQVDPAILSHMFPNYFNNNRARNSALAPVDGSELNVADSAMFDSDGQPRLTLNKKKMMYGKHQINRGILAGNKTSRWGNHGMTNNQFRNVNVSLSIHTKEYFVIYWIFLISRIEPTTSRF